MSTPAPGWYPDGVTPGAVRWFDGVGWTAHLAPVAGPAPWPGAMVAAPPGPGDDSGPGSALHWVVPVGRSWQSIAAGYVGLFSLLLWPLGPVAIWLGWWAMVRARNGGHGRGRALTGIITGAVGTVLGVWFLISTV